MLELEFTARDLAHTRFAVSPLWEVVASVRVLRRPDEHPLHRPWLAAVRPRLAAARLDWQLLADLVPEGPLAIPVFVAPPPTSSVPDLGVELAALRATPPEQVRAELAGPRAPRTERVEALRQDPEAELAHLADIVAAYWEIALAPYWPRLRALLEGDVLHRARLLAQGGIQQLFTDLDPRVSWAGERLSVEHRYGGGGRRLGGRGLLLIPSAFVWPQLFSVTVPGRQPTLRYPPRGVAALWERRDREPARALAAVLGRTRARLLAELDAPAATEELASRTGVTAGGISQHLGALRAAGLVAATRAGRQVLYRRTEAAEVLLTAADRDPR